jgi:hypothetical protein
MNRVVREATAAQHLHQGDGGGSCSATGIEHAQVGSQSIVFLEESLKSVPVAECRIEPKVFIDLAGVQVLDRVHKNLFLMLPGAVLSRFRPLARRNALESGNRRIVAGGCDAGLPPQQPDVRPTISLPDGLKEELSVPSTRDRVWHERVNSLQVHEAGGVHHAYDAMGRTASVGFLVPDRSNGSTRI